MSIEHNEAVMRFEARAKALAKEEITRNKEADLADVESEEEQSILATIDQLSKLPPTDKIASKLPSNDEEMSTRLDGTSCRFGDSGWYWIDEKTDREVPILFCGKFEKRSLNFTDPLTEALKILHKLLIYIHWPHKDLTKWPLGARTLKTIHNGNTTLLDWLYSNGHLMTADVMADPPSCDLVTAEALSEEINRRIDDGAPYKGAVIDFCKAIQSWIILSHKPYCPDWLKPSFNYSEVVDKHLAKKMAKYIAKSRTRWEAIDFEDLQPLLSTAKNFIEVYSKDLFWVEAQLTKAVEEREEHGENSAQILSVGTTMGIFNDLTAYQFANNPDTGKPWFKIPTFEQDGYRAVDKRAISAEIDRLIGAATFMSLLFTGLRHDTLTQLKADSLTIKGAPVDLEGEIFAQVESAKENDFDLTRPTLKTDPLGKPEELPIPPIVAKAFAIIFEVFRYGRDLNMSDYLFSAGGIIRHGNIGRPSKHKSLHKLNKYLVAICSAAGIEYQHAHKCRKTLATLLINHDPESLEVIRLLLSHKSVVMTMEYIMCLPGVNEEILVHMREAEYEKIVRFATYLVQGKVAGAGGNRALDNVLKNLEYWKGERLLVSMSHLLKSYENANFFIHRTPAAWCLRIDAQVPRNAPCLPPAIRKALKNGDHIPGTPVHPVPEDCIPWECGDACHTPDDMDVAKRSLGYALKQASNNGPKAQTTEKYEHQAEYWGAVVQQLEHGRQDIVNEHLLEALGG